MRTIPPLVATGWLADNIADQSLVIVDIRDSQEYKTGHIPRAANIPFPSWAVERNGLLLELPETDDLFHTIGAAGIESGSRVVVVNKTDTSFDLADAARTAYTLLYAGVENAAVLDGGYNKWIKEGREVSDKAVRPQKTDYQGKINEGLFVTKAYVKEKLEKAIIIDARTPDVFFGVVQEPFTQRPGHIPGAACLPTPWIWTEAGTYKSAEELRDMASRVAGTDTSREIILYCGVGGYGSVWCFVLREILGYTNVKLYNGAAQEWTADPEAPVARYRWD
jgi:thiosulfate/3-mercaptopyruvate sulfurtransferase